MSDLDIDTTVLREGGESLRIVATEFEHANTRSDDAAEACGHSGLGERVRSFAHNWDDRREKMLENIVTLAEYAKVTGETFEEVENEFVAALEGRA